MFIVHCHLGDKKWGVITTPRFEKTNYLKTNLLKQIKILSAKLKRKTFRCKSFIKFFIDLCQKEKKRRRTEKFVSLV